MQAERPSAPGAAGGATDREPASRSVAQQPPIARGVTLTFRSTGSPRRSMFLSTTSHYQVSFLCSRAWMGELTPATTFEGRVMTRELQGKGFEGRWKAMSVADREETVLWALQKTTDAVRDESEVRGECVDPF